MSLIYQGNGFLGPGIHSMTTAQFVAEFGFNPHRMTLLDGLHSAISDLKSVGCRWVYIDGSFVSKKLFPNDYDACWDEMCVDLQKLKDSFPVFFDFTHGRAAQKRIYKGEWMPARGQVANKHPRTLFINFFQMDKEGIRKGIVCLTL